MCAPGLPSERTRKLRGSGGGERDSSAAFGFGMTRGGSRGPASVSARADSSSLALLGMTRWGRAARLVEENRPRTCPGPVQKSNLPRIIE